LTQLEGIRGREQQRDIKDLEGKATNPDFHRLYPMTTATVCTPVAARSSGKATPAMDYSTASRNPNSLIPKKRGAIASRVPSPSAS